MASAPGKHSQRAIETLKPLAKVLGMKIDSSIQNNDFLGFATQVKQTVEKTCSAIFAGANAPDDATARLLVAWTHDEIPYLLKYLNVPGVADFKPWDGAEYDQVWQVQLQKIREPSSSVATNTTCSSTKWSASGRYVLQEGFDGTPSSPCAGDLVWSSARVLAVPSWWVCTALCALLARQ
jgi:hypothetical protein